ncbi:MAG: fibronectin type III domain-containing protein [Nitrospiraceae bacterium]|nr:fibronectin type III domain-containing protein [Nitrospiraceae bacterium]
MPYKSGKKHGIFFLFSIFWLFSLIAGCGGGGANGAGSGSVTLTWNATTTNTNGAPITDLAGYKVRYRTASQNPASAPVVMVNTTACNSSNQCTYALNGLQAGNTYYFAVAAYDTSGNVSNWTPEVSKAV